MKMILAGLKRKSGEYQGKKYDNFYLGILVTDSGASSLIAGSDFTELKIKAEDFVSALDRNIKALNSPNVKEAKDIIGLEIVPAFSTFQGVTSDFTLSFPQKAK